MTPLEVLKRITKYTEENIAPLLLMRKEVEQTSDVFDQNEPTPEYVNPAVTYGAMAHKNFQPLDYSVPMILWTFDEVDDAGTYSEGRKVFLRAHVGAYSGEFYENAETKMPDNKAFVDLINALETMYVKLSGRNVIDGVGIEKPINYGSYDGNFYPYAYGWLTLTAEITRMEFADEIDLDKI